MIIKKKSSCMLPVQVFYCTYVVKKFSLLSTFFDQCWPKTAGLSGEDPPKEIQDPDSGWGHCCSRHGDGWPYSEDHQDGVQGQHGADHSTQAQHHHGLR